MSKHPINDHAEPVVPTRGISEQFFWTGNPLISPLFFLNYFPQSAAINFSFSQLGISCKLTFHQYWATANLSESKAYFRSDEPIESEVTMHGSVIAALGALIPLASINDAVNPEKNNVFLQIEGSDDVKLVNANGTEMGENMEDGSWKLSVDELNELHLANLPTGQYELRVSSSPSGEAQGYQPYLAVVELNVIDTANNPLTELEYGQGLGDGLSDSVRLNFAQNDPDVDVVSSYDESLNNHLQDVFTWNLAEHGSLEHLGIDIITDFKPEDRINLSELLDGEHQGHFTEYLHIEYDASNDQTIVSISNDGQFDGSEVALADYAAKADHEIVIEHVNLVGNSVDQALVIDNLIAAQQLVVES